MSREDNHSKNGIKVPKTNAMRILDSANVHYEVITYEVDPDHLDAVHAAASAGIDVQRVFKTIVMTTTNKEIFVFCVPAEFEISLKKARDITGAKGIDLINLDQLRPLTGYIRGGCSPLGMIHSYPTYIDELAQLYDTIYVSAGLRGVQLCLNPLDLASCCNAQFVCLT